jgi:phosphinothricin acetyltransferase
VGRRLYTRLFELLIELGYFQAIAGITLPNAASVGLHEAMGFEAVSRYRNVGHKQGAWHDVGYWQKALRPLQKPLPPTPFHGGA